VDAGFDRFSPGADGKIFQALCGRSIEHLLAGFCSLWAGAIRMTTREPFNMAYLALRGCGAVNGGQPFARGSQPADIPAIVPTMAGTRKFPVGHVTNGVQQTPTWDSADAAPCGRTSVGSIAGGATLIRGAGCSAVDDSRLWQLRSAARNVSSSTLENVWLASAPAKARTTADCRSAARLRSKYSDPGFRAPLRAYKRPTFSCKIRTGCCAS